MKEGQAFRQFWNNADTIEQFAQRPPDPYLKPILESIADRQSKSALDLGCGAGRNTELLLSYGFRTFACDINPGMLMETRRRILHKFNAGSPNLTLARMSELPYSDNSFDVVISNGVFHNATTEEELHTTFANTVRILRPGGVLLLSQFTGDSIDHDSLSQVPNTPIFITRENTKMVLYSSDKIIELANGLGLTVTGETQRKIYTLDTGNRANVRTVLTKLE